MIYSLKKNNWLSELGTEQEVDNAICSIMHRWQHGVYLQPVLDELPDVMLFSKRR